MSITRIVSVFIYSYVLFAFSPAHGIEKFHQSGSRAIEVWRITNDPKVRDYANYHNTKCWSPDGRYICFTHYAADKNEYGTKRAAEVHLADIHTGKDITIDHGIQPRWANHHNWLLYMRVGPEQKDPITEGPQIMRYDVAAGKRARIADGFEYLKETDYADRWVYGIIKLADGSRKGVRVPIVQNSQHEILPGDWQAGYNSLYVNPAHPLIVSRDHGYLDYHYASPGTTDIPFVARHFLDHDLEGEIMSKPFPIMDGTHFAWSGNGSYFLVGNGCVRGRKWDEALPSNIHFLANIHMGDIGACGSSGRWVCGSSIGGGGALRIADLRSGDGWEVMNPYSFLCYPSKKDNSGAYDINAKGSPDGTKIAFVSTYDLKNGPATRLTANHTGDCIQVESTKGFPDQGELVYQSGFGGEVVGYSSKTADCFKGISRGRYGTSSTSSMKKGKSVTSFKSLVIAEKQRKGLALPSRKIQSIVKNNDSPLMWQRSSDIYIAVVRLPDRPYLQLADGTINLIPGENHREIRGYIIYCDGRSITNNPVPSGSSFILPRSGTYTTVAIEWSGLRSKHSIPLKISGEITLNILSHPPDDFSWTYSRSLPVNETMTDKNENVEYDTVREVLHVYDGVIQRDFFRHGQLVERQDLNHIKIVTRRLRYINGHLHRREYFNEDAKLVSTEIFSTNGEIVESIRKGSHWWYKNASPLRHVRKSKQYQKTYTGWINGGLNEEMKTLRLRLIDPKKENKY
jgi:hypothetical protein